MYHLRLCLHGTGVNTSASVYMANYGTNPKLFQTHPKLDRVFVGPVLDPFRTSSVILPCKQKSVQFGSERFWSGRDRYCAVVSCGAVYYAVLGGSSFESVDEILKCNDSNESYWVVLSFGTVYYAVCKVVLTFESVDEILTCDHSNESCWAVHSWCCLLFPLHYLVTCFEHGQTWQINDKIPLLFFKN